MSASENLTLKQWVNHNMKYLRRSATLTDHPREFRQMVRYTPWDVRQCLDFHENKRFLFQGNHLKYSSPQTSRPFKMSSYFAISYIVVFQVTFSVRRSLVSLTKSEEQQQQQYKRTIGKTVWFYGRRLSGSNCNATLHRKAFPVTQRYFQTYSSLFPNP